MLRARYSRSVYVPAAVSSFFQICDRAPNGSPLKDPLRIGSRGGGFVIKKGTLTKVSLSERPEVFINGRKTPEARTTLKVISLMRDRFDLPPVKVFHSIEPPIGSGFGTSGSGALGAAIALKDLFGLNLTLAQTAAFAHVAEVESLTGLGTVISLASGAGSVGLVTEPGSYSIGQVDSIFINPSEHVLVCAWFGPVEKSSVLKDGKKRSKLNQVGYATLRAILKDPTPTTLLSKSQEFASKSQIGSKELLVLSKKATKLGAIGATQNMIGNAIHCLVKKDQTGSFVRTFGKLVPKNSIFTSELVESGPKIL